MISQGVIGSCKPTQLFSVPTFRRVFLGVVVSSNIRAPAIRTWLSALGNQNSLGAYGYGELRRPMTFVCLEDVERGDRCSGIRV